MDPTTLPLHRSGAITRARGALAVTAGAVLLLDPDLMIRGVSPGYLDATGTVPEQLAGRFMFDAFPDNPATPSAGSVAHLSVSLENVLRTGRYDRMPALRYDVPDRAHPGEFTRKVWLPFNSPIQGAGRLAGVLHRVEDVTYRHPAVLDRLRTALEARTTLDDLPARDSHPDSLRRAIAFLDRNAGRPVDIGQVARAAFVTPRAVQAVFARHLGCTPMGYLRLVRLDNAHHELLAATAGQVTIAAIGSRWGFTSPSAFAAAYRATYGHAPTDTLRAPSPVTGAEAGDPPAQPGRPGPSA